MKTFILAAILMLLPMQTWAELNTRTKLRAFTFDMLNLPPAGTNQLDTAKANRAINAALGQASEDFESYMKLDTITLTGAHQYSLNTDCLRVSYVWTPDTVRSDQGGSIEYIVAEAYTPVLIDSLWLKIGGSRGFSGATPNMYGSDRSLILIFPDTSGGSQSLYIRYVAKHPVLTTDTNTVLLPEDNERVAAANLACAFLSKMRREFGDAEYFRQEYEMAVQKRRIERQAERTVTEQ